jgi:hypothetical protein
MRIAQAWRRDRVSSPSPLIPTGYIRTPMCGWDFKPGHQGFKADPSLGVVSAQWRLASSAAPQHLGVVMRCFFRPGDWQRSRLRFGRRPETGLAARAEGGAGRVGQMFKRRFWNETEKDKKDVEDSDSSSSDDEAADGLGPPGEGSQSGSDDEGSSDDNSQASGRCAHCTARCVGCLRRRRLGEWSGVAAADPSNPPPPRAVSTHGQQSAAQGSSTTVSRSDIRLIQHLDSSAHGMAPEVALNWLFPDPLITPRGQWIEKRLTAGCVQR